MYKCGNILFFVNMDAIELLGSSMFFYKIDIVCFNLEGNIMLKLICLLRLSARNKILILCAPI